MKLFKKHGKVNSFLRSRPKLYDFSRKTGHALGGGNQDYRILKKVSDHFNHEVTFIQIGASDGMINDPIRDFVVRDQWSGLFIEPLPFSYEKLQHNYSYLGRSDLFYENAAIGSGGQKTLEFWTYSDHFLNELNGKEHRDMYRRRSSFNKEHVLSFLPGDLNPDSNLTSIAIPILSVKELIKKHGLTGKINLLTVDAEGLDQEIIESTLKDAIQPDVIFFESDHFDGKLFLEKLNSYGYVSREYKTDTISVLSKHQAILD